MEKITHDDVRRHLSMLIQTLEDHGASLDDSHVKVFMYLDEAHVLTEKIAQDGRLALDVFLGAFNIFTKQPIFLILLSTQSDIDHLAPSVITARSSRYRTNIQHIHAPITETPFDCFDRPILCVSLGLLSTVTFMALFGRPLCVLCESTPDP